MTIEEYIAKTYNVFASNTLKSILVYVFNNKRTLITSLYNAWLYLSCVSIVEISTNEEGILVIETEDVTIKK